MGMFDRVRSLIEDTDDFDDDELDEPEDIAEEPKRSAPRTRSERRFSSEISSSATPVRKNRPASEDCEDQENEDYSSSPAARPKLTLHTSKSAELTVDVHVPSSFDQAARIADDLLAHRAAVINFERIDGPEQQQKICDFINGVSYVLDCEVRRISEKMMLYVPSGVNIMTLKTESRSGR